MSIDEALTIVAGAIQRIDARVQRLEDCCEASKQFKSSVQPVIQFVQQAFLNNSVNGNGQCSCPHSGEEGNASGGNSGEQDPVFSAFQKEVTEELGERSNQLNQ